MKKTKSVIINRRRTPRNTGRTPGSAASSPSIKTRLGAFIYPIVASFLLLLAVSMLFALFALSQFSPLAQAIPSKIFLAANSK